MFTTIMSNNGTGTRFGKGPLFVVLGLLMVLPLSVDVALGGLDGDGNLDAVFANSLQQNSVCLGDGAGGFTCSDVGTDTKESRGVALGMVDGDTNLDAVFANSNQKNRVCLGNGSGASLPAVM